MQERIVIVGGGPAACSAARGYRDAGGRGIVTLFSDDDRAPYDRPPLSKDVLRGDAEPSLLERAARYAAIDVEIRTGTRVAAIDRTAHHVTLDDGDVLGYDRLVLATGAQPVRPDLPGADAGHVHVLRTARHAAALREAVGPGTRVAVVGAGFIGCEAAASLARRGADVTLVGQEEAPLAARIGAAAGERVGAWLDAEGVRRRHGEAVTAIEPGACTVGEDAVGADVVLLVAGVRRRVELAEAAGLHLGTDGISAGHGQRTSDPDIVAAGDCAETLHPVAGRRLLVEHWGDALAQGEVAGRRLAGDAGARWDAVPGFWSQVGDHWLKQAAWGDGWWSEHLVDHPGGGWTVWYADDDGRCVGVLTAEADDDWERGRRLVAEGGPCPGFETG